MPNFATVCKIEGCGKPRRLDQTLALCDEHYCEYQRAAYWRLKAPTKKRRARFTEADVIEMRSLRRQGWSLQQLADRYSSSFRYMSEICIGKAWRHVA